MTAGAFDDHRARPGFEYRPAVPGMLRLLVMQRSGIWKTELPIRVEP